MGSVEIVGLICSGISLSFILLSSALPYWERITLEDRVVTIGLWMTCTKWDIAKEALCSDLTDVPEYILAVRAFVLMGLFLVASATVLELIRTLVVKENKKISLIAGAISVAAGSFMLIGAIVYAARSSYLSEDTPHYHVGFAFAIIAGVVGVVAGILAILESHIYNSVQMWH